MSSLNIRQLRLRDYRCFEALDIDFHPQLTVLVASNGAGKTSILDALAVALGPFVGAFDEAVGKHFELGDIRLARVRDTQTNEMEYAAKGVRLEALGFIPGSLNARVGDGGDALSRWKRTLAAPTKAKTSIKDAKDLITYGKALQAQVRTPGNKVTLPLVAYYGTGRLWQQKKLTGHKLTRTSRTIGYTDCLDTGSSYKAFLAWFKYWCGNAREARLKAFEQSLPFTLSEFDHYIASVATAVAYGLRPTGWTSIDYSFTRNALVARHPEHGELPVDWLSDGIRNMIAMVADIAFRATKLNGHLGAEAAQKTPGIVLIDEVDMHLHPEWQQVVLQGLQEAFPLVQFIVTTHSPQVLSTVPAANIRVLRQAPDGTHEALQPTFSPLAHESGDALARIMGTLKEPPLALQDTIRAYEQCVRAGKETTPEAQALKAKMDAAGYQLHDSDLATWRFLAARKLGGA